MTLTFYRNTLPPPEPPMKKSPPEPSPIVRAFGGATVGFECMECHRLHPAPTDHYAFLKETSPLDWARQNAIECCGDWRCDKHGQEFKRGTSCRECWKEQLAAKELATYERAKKVLLADYGGEYVYREGYGREGFICVGNLDSSDATDPDQDPKWAFGCDRMTVSESDADLTDHVAEGILADYHEGASDWVDDEKVKEASRLIFEACKDVATYTADESIVVLFEHKA